MVLGFYERNGQKYRVNVEWTQTSHIAEKINTEKK